MDNKLVMDTLNEAIRKKKMYMEQFYILTNDSNIHLTNIKLSANQMEYVFP